MPLTLAAAGWLVGILTVLFMVVCIVLILTVLIQRPQGGGLAGAFGSGAGSGQTAFGTKTGDALTIFTIIVFVLFVGAAIGLNYAARPEVASATPTSNKNTTDKGAAPAGNKPAEQPSDKPAEPSTPPAAESPTPADKPADKPADQPADKPAEQPSDKPADKPAEPPKSV